MADTVSSKRRSEIMSNIKGKHTKPEMIVREFLHSKGFRYRIHDKKLPGTPDIKLTKYKTVIFVNGCFWHGHENCRIYVMPKTNVDFWNGKIEKNIGRDKIIINNFEELGWNVIVLWECALKKTKRNETLNSVVEKIISFGQKT
ncbi:very short patch repair endonuclease [Mucilaginibacter pocheonensis]|uniref:Very short patch repair endonuclease n=1 Tax=Mucilaginibacter pocheonensis TaxID=398050 RepID=A0ABU1TAR7_9SPHI|nr:DNA mismatch endonuclease Vsr [Mucilaginibacter pocheonensis]MDR6941940.1 DNA mismatch endonuclease (patch repair protein) [Mucilaginibacter pocheonensis]